jgi:hypothetical protein
LLLGTEPRLPPNAERKAHSDSNRKDANPGGAVGRKAWHDRKAENLEGLWGGTWYEHRAPAVKARSRADEGPRNWARHAHCSRSSIPKAGRLSELPEMCTSRWFTCPRRLVYSGFYILSAAL